jgi:hypothetical protein
MNKKIKIFGQEIWIGTPTYAKLTALLVPQILLIAVIMLVLSFTFSFSLALILLKEQGIDLIPMQEGIDFWFKLPMTFIMLIWIALTSAAMDEIQKKQDKKRYSKPLI